MARTTTAPSAQAAAVRGRRFSKSTSDSLWALFFVAPQLIGLFIFSFIPLVAVFVLSLVDWGGIGPLTWVDGPRPPRPDGAALQRPPGGRPPPRVESASRRPSN